MGPSKLDNHEQEQFLIRGTIMLRGMYVWEGGLPLSNNVLNALLYTSSLLQAAYSLRVTLATNVQDIRPCPRNQRKLHMAQKHHIRQLDEVIEIPLSRKINRDERTSNEKRIRREIQK
ncbi:hypothetical protein ASPWEDRAFT_297955 [Aspergillus wentii DTO 134E9]|uniref:Uncharacterized protein n=1 Tax=Aspergillus wentii DTO 134E9 TaxID=1073089 RepID=A0A1L9R4F9_ASPWE|nr:uncharacterized protein ASPWEDRAFT_297955 [Aspergillus wentii DTO 134E9]OJJ29811.1 hypothetical protein ASPWEDRAFT_297955 [Aspergillus wentii DTO 134E9]